MWICRTCREEVESHFDACWKCGTSKEGAPDPAVGARERDERNANTGAFPSQLFGQTPKPALVAGIEIRCAICRHDYFVQRTAQLHTAVATFFDLEWLSPTATCLICARCGYIHWFLPP